MVTTNQMESEESGPGNPAFSRLSLLRTIWKRKVRIAVAWVLFALVGMVVVRLLPAVYLSEAIIVVDSQQIPEKFVSATVASNLEERIASIRETLLSGGELKKIIEDFGLYRKERQTHFEEEILETMRKNISITLESVGSGANNKRTAAFRIGFQGSDPVLVMRVANRLTDLYVEQNAKTREGQAAGTSQFIDTQLGDAKKRLDELEAAVSAYKLQHNGELPQQEQSLGSALSRFQTELEANRDAINRAQQTKIVLEGSVSSMDATLAAQTRSWEQTQKPADANEPVSVGGQPSASRQKKTSEAMAEQLAVLRSHYSEKHPDVIRLRTAIEKVKRDEEQLVVVDPQEANAPLQPIGVTRPLSAAREPAEVAHTREQVGSLRAQIQGADKELEVRKAEQQRILRDINQYQARIERLPVREQEMAAITRDYEMAKTNYKSLLDKKMAAEMSLDMEHRQQSERFNIVDRAQLPEKPTKPNRPLFYAVAAALGLVLALVVGFGTEMRRDVVLGEWELPEGTLVLARLPYIGGPVVSPPAKSPSRGRGFMPWSRVHSD